MKCRLLSKSGFVGALLISTACTPTTRSDDVGVGDADTALTIIVDAEVYTLDPNFPFAESFAYDHDGTILAVGTEAEVRSALTDEAEIIDAGGALVLPGFQDAHVHVPEAGMNAELCFIEGGRRLDDYVDDVAACAENQPASEWVLAAGVPLFELRSEGQAPLLALDEAVPDRPVLVLDDLGHAVWTNSLGLEAAGITGDSPDPHGGIIHRDPETDGLSGLLLEDAQQLVRNAAATHPDIVYAGLLAAMDELAANGITTVSDAGGYWQQGHPAAWQRAETEATLLVRGANSLYLYPDLDIDTQLDEFASRFDNSSDLVRFDTAKIYIDGILDLGTALLLEPYDEPIDPNHPTGFTYFARDDLRLYVNELHQLGYRISFHAIGDGAIREALDAVAAINDAPEAIAARRHRTTHTYLVHADDLGRYGALGVVADVQHSPDAIDTDYHEHLSQFIGDRAFDLIPAGTLAASGAPMAMSSDWDAGPLSPLGTIERSLTREVNRLSSVEFAVALLTLDAAYALGHDDLTGSIEVGKQADYVLLDQNIFEIDVNQIDETNILLTVMAGRRTYQSAEFD